MSILAPRASAQKKTSATRALSVSLLLLATSGLFTGTASADDDFEGETIVAIEADFRWDLGSMQRDTTVDRNPFRDERSDLSGYGPSFRFMFLRQMWEHLSMGAAFQYNARARYVSEGDVDDDPFELGQQMALDFRLEPRVSLTDQIELIGVFRVGMLIISPGGDLEDAIQTNQSTGLSTWNAPRLGILLGGDAGVRWRPESVDWIGIRATIGYAWQHMWLMNSRGSTGPIRTHDKWTASVSRIRFGFGVELVF